MTNSVTETHPPAGSLRDAEKMFHELGEVVASLRVVSARDCQHALAIMEAELALRLKPHADNAVVAVAASGIRVGYRMAIIQKLLAGLAANGT